MSRPLGPCTWWKCREEAAHEHFRGDGLTWARLCGYHEQALEESLGRGELSGLLLAGLNARTGAALLAPSDTSTWPRWDEVAQDLEEPEEPETDR